MSENINFDDLIVGDFYTLDEKLLHPLKDKLVPFIDYVNNQSSDD